MKKHFIFRVIMVADERVEKEFVGRKCKEVRHEAEAFADKARKRFKDEVGVYVVSCTKAYPPKDTDMIKLKSGKLWCPYCRRVCRFPGGAKNGYTCPICGITDLDFWVKTYNHMWPRMRFNKKGD